MSTVAVAWYQTPQSLVFIKNLNNLVIVPSHVKGGLWPKIIAALPVTRLQSVVRAITPTWRMWCCEILSTLAARPVV